MEDDLNLFVYGRLYGIVSNITSNVKQGIQIRFTKLKMEDDLNYFVNGRTPPFGMWKRTPMLSI